VEHFFGTYKQLEAAVVQSQGWEPVEKAKEEVSRACQRWFEEHDPKAARKAARSKAAEASTKKSAKSPSVKKTAARRSTKKSTTRK
jgi:hypothetical protein